MTEVEAAYGRQRCWVVTRRWTECACLAPDTRSTSSRPSESQWTADSATSSSRYYNRSPTHTRSHMSHLSCSLAASQPTSIPYCLLTRPQWRVLSSTALLRHNNNCPVHAFTAGWMDNDEQCHAICCWMNRKSYTKFTLFWSAKRLPRKGTSLSLFRLPNDVTAVPTNPQ